MDDPLVYAIPTTIACLSDFDRGVRKLWKSEREVTQVKPLHHGVRPAVLWERAVTQQTAKRERQKFRSCRQLATTKHKENRRHQS